MPLTRRGSRAVAADRSTIRFPAPGPQPLVAVARLMRALYEGDRRLEEESLRELERIDLHLVVGPSWRKGGGP